MTKRVLAILLAAIFVLFAFSSCKNNNDADDEETTGSNDTEKTEDTAKETNPYFDEDGWTVGWY